MYHIVQLQTDWQQMLMYADEHLMIGLLMKMNQVERSTRAVRCKGPVVNVVLVQVKVVPEQVEMTTLQTVYRWKWWCWC